MAMTRAEIAGISKLTTYRTYRLPKNIFCLILPLCWLDSITFKYFLAGELIAIASQNGSIYLFRVSRDGFSYKKSNKIRGSQPLMQMDWSSDSNFLQTVTADYDLAFCKYNNFGKKYKH